MRGRPVGPRPTRRMGSPAAARASVVTASPDPPPRPEADLLSAAVEYAAQGIAIMPCVEREKTPALQRTGKEHAAATFDTDLIQSWWTTNPKWNIGIVCTANRLAVIDIDGPAGIEWIHDNQLPMPATWTATTGNGFHYYYRWPAGQRIKTCRIAPKLEIRGAGAYVIAPPSTHPNGATYQWHPDRSDWGALPDLPPEWVSLQPTPETNGNVTSLDNKHEPADNTVALKRLAGLAKHLAEKAEGERHSALYTIARTLGQLVASGHLTRDQIYAQLYDAAQRNGGAAEDGGHNITRTINDGIEKGVSDGPDPEHSEPGDGNPFTLPPKGFTNGAPDRLCSWCEGTAKYLWRAPTGGEGLCDTCRAEHTRRTGYVLPAADTIRPEDVKWYFEGRVPLGSLTLLVGPAGLGKTTFACELSARGSRGELGCPAASVIFATAEDSLAHTLVPRLTAAGADLAQIRFMKIVDADGFETGLTLPEDTAKLQDAVKKTGANLIILDPVVGHLSGNIDSHKDHSVRRALAPLARLAEDTGAAILGIGHLNKSSSTDVLTRVGGSVAFGAAARSVLLFGEDPNAVEGSPERLLIHAKSNLGPTSLVHRLKIEARTITTEGRDISTSGLAWLGEELTATASKVLAGRQEPSRLDKATDFLREVLADGPLPASEVKALATDRDITEVTLKRARKKLGIASKREGFGDGSSWTLPSIVIPHSDHHSGQGSQDDPNGGSGSRKPLQDKGSSIRVIPPHSGQPLTLDPNGGAGNEMEADSPPIFAAGAGCW